jgi:23S rRNA pseudouridine1911/1915/1917 synthase
MRSHTARSPRSASRLISSWIAATESAAPTGCFGAPGEKFTHLRPIAALAGATLVECRLETGRQHQIRIHLSELGHPLVGERVYIRDYTGRKIDAMRPMLHARVLGFVHPRTGRRMSFEREAPEDFRAMIESLRATLR